MESKGLSDEVGHSNLAVTFPIYAHRFPARDRTAADLIGRMIAEAVDEAREAG